MKLVVTLEPSTEPNETQPFKTEEFFEKIHRTLNQNTASEAWTVKRNAPEDL